MIFVLGTFVAGNQVEPPRFMARSIARPPSTTITVVAATALAHQGSQLPNIRPPWRLKLQKTSLLRQTWHAVQSDSSGRDEVRMVITRAIVDRASRRNDAANVLECVASISRTLAKLFAGPHISP